MGTKYNVIGFKGPEFPIRELLEVKTPQRKFIASLKSFGPNTYSDNQEAMLQNYSHPLTWKRISFRPATTFESIFIASHNFKILAKEEIFNPRWLQAGYIVRTQDGVFVNTEETDESKLKQMLDECEEVNGIFLGKNDFGFAPYETFELDVQDSGTFSRGGLARALEHTKEKVAENLGDISSQENYKRGVNVWGFDNVNKPILRIASLDSDRCFDGDRLGVGGVDVDGYAFGVLNSEKSE